jgi:hypothetical protein
VAVDVVGVAVDACVQPVASASAPAAVLWRSLGALLSLHLSWALCPAAVARQGPLLCGEHAQGVTRCHPHCSRMRTPRCPYQPALSPLSQTVPSGHAALCLSRPHSHTTSASRVQLYRRPHQLSQHGGASRSTCAPGRPCTRHHHSPTSSKHGTLEFF